MRILGLTISARSAALSPGAMKSIIAPVTRARLMCASCSTTVVNQSCRCKAERIAASVARTPALGGAVFAALSDQRFRHFSDSYKARYNTAPYRIATLGYDAVLLTLRIGREWRDGAPFPAQRLYDKGGFLGLDGVFRFNGDAVIERALELRQVKGGMVSVISAAPARFDD